MAYIPAEIAFIDNPAINGREEKFVTVTIAMAPVLASWRESMFAHEWLHNNGSVKKPAEQSAVIQDRRQRIRDKLGHNGPLERPVLGIGIMDNVEIGAGRDILLTLAAEGLDKIPVHIPRSNLSEFRKFIKD